MNDLKLLQEAYAKICEGSEDIPQEVQDYIVNNKRGNLNLDSLLYPGPISLPDNLTVRGSLYLRNSLIKALPKNLRIEGDLNLSGADITTLPSDIKVGGFIELGQSKIETLPDNLTVNSSLSVAGTKIKKLPKGLKVKYSLFLYGLPIERVEDLPADLEVQGRIESRYFTDKEAKTYLARIKQLNKKLSDTFSKEDLEALEDF